MKCRVCRNDRNLVLVPNERVGSCQILFKQVIAPLITRPTLLVLFCHANYHPLVPSINCIYFFLIGSINKQQNCDLLVEIIILHSTMLYTIAPSIPQQQSWMSTNMTHSLHYSQEVYSWLELLSKLQNNKNMGDFSGWTSSMNKHTDQSIVGCYWVSELLP